MALSGGDPVIYARIPVEKLKNYIDKFLDCTKYQGNQMPTSFSIPAKGKNLMLREDGTGSVTIEIEPDEEAPLDAIPEFVTQSLPVEDTVSLYHYTVDKITQAAIQPKRNPFTGADFNF